MPINASIREKLALSSLALFLLAAALPAKAQQAAMTPQQRRPTTITAPEMQKAPAPVAGQTNLYCAGFVRLDSFNNRGQLVGGAQEQEKFLYAQGAFVFINAGSQQSVKEGDEFMVVRPLGKVEHVYKQKHGPLGVYFRELGRLRVTKVQAQVSVAQIENSCAEMLLGDLITEMPSRTSPAARENSPLDQFSDPSGKAVGRLLMARDNLEMPSRNDIVYVDLGAEDNVKVGDYLTIFRHVGDGSVFKTNYEEIAPGSLGGFGSDAYHGGGFSNGAMRAQEKGAGMFTGHPTKGTKVKNHRPDPPRKVIGEAVILNVQQRTATAIITRVGQEIHTGDWVEIQ